MWPGQVCTIPQLYVCSFSAFPARQAVGKSAVCNRDGMDDTQRPQNSPSRLWPNRRHFVWLPAINLKPASCSPPSRRMSCSFFRCSWSGGYRKWNNFWNIKVLRVYSTPAESNDLVSAVVGGGAPQFHSSTAAGCLKIKAQSRRGSVLADETETYLLIACLFLHWSTPSPFANSNLQCPRAAAGAWHPSNPSYPSHPWPGAMDMAQDALLIYGIELLLGKFRFISMRVLRLMAESCRKFFIDKDSNGGYSIDNIFGIFIYVCISSCGNVLQNRDNVAYFWATHKNNL